MENFVTLNVGGSLYTTTRATLTRFPSSMIGALFKYVGPTAVTKDEKGRVFIDRDGALFRHVLNYLRRGYVVLPEGFSELDMLADEAMFYELPKLADLLHEHKSRHVNKLKSTAVSEGHQSPPPVPERPYPPPLLSAAPLPTARTVAVPETPSERELLTVKLIFQNYGDMTTYDSFLIIKRNKTICATAGHLTGRVDTFREIPNAKFHNTVVSQFSEASSAFIVSLPMAPAYATEHQLFQDLTKLGFRVDGFSSECQRVRRDGEESLDSYKSIFLSRPRKTGIR